jgi:hypothetical protein
MKRLALTLFGFTFCAMLLAGDADERGASGAHEKAAINQVEVRLRDGSVLHGDLTGVDTIALKTTYGTLNFPLSHILRIRAGFRLSKQDETDILGAIKELDSDDFNVRGLAQRRLEERGAPAAAVLRDAKAKATPEVRNRVESILKKIAENNPKLVLDDIIKSDEFEATGSLQFDSLTIKSHIGDVKVKLEDMESMRFLANGADKSLSLEASAGLDNWVDTGIDSTPNEKVSIFCSGSVNLFNNYQTTPDGNTNWGNRPFLAGAVVGKFGENGKPFLIGAAKQLVAANRQRLFVKIFCPENVVSSNSNPSSGEFRVRIATGIWADDATAADDGDSSVPRRVRGKH